MHLQIDPSKASKKTSVKNLKQNPIRHKEEKTMKIVIKPQLLRI
jgi:hypothetical protein